MTDSHVLRCGSLAVPLQTQAASISQVLKQVFAYTWLGLEIPSGVQVSQFCDSF